MHFSKMGWLHHNLYNLMFRHPATLNVQMSDNSRKCRYYLVGDRSCSEVCKIVFWCGQLIDTDLEIYIYSADTQKIENELRSLPEMENYAEFRGLESTNALKHHYASITLIPCHDFYSNRIAFPINSNSFIITCFEDREKSLKVAENIASFIDGLNCNVTIASLTSEANGTHVLRENNNKSFFANANEKDLLRVAKNIMFSYDMKYDQFCKRESSWQNFEEKRKTEFSAESFSGSHYDADSSMASAVHTAVKLELCKEYGNAHEVVYDDALTILANVIFQKNDFYNALIELEHRRWLCYMVTRGYRSHTPEELAFVYENGNTHKDDRFDQLLHACICSSGKDGLYLEKQKTECWLDPDYVNDSKMSELDKVSVLCYQKASDQVNKLQSDANSQYKKLYSGRYQFNSDVAELQQSIEHLFADMDIPANIRYRSSIDDAKKRKLLPDTLISSIEAELKIVEIRNQRIDFYAYDAQLIEMLPFCVWYGDHFKTVVTFSSGNAAEDVIVPTLLSADNAVFFGNDVEDHQYQTSIKEFFANRGHTIPTFIVTRINGIDSVMNTINHYIIPQYGQSQLVFNCVNTSQQEVLLAFGKYSEQNALLKYDPLRGLICFSNHSSAVCGLAQKSFLFQEYIRLLDGDSEKDGVAIHNPLLFKKLKDVIIADINRSHSYNKGEGRIWTQMGSFFERCAKDFAPNILGRAKSFGHFNQQVEYSDSFPNNVFNGCQIERFLRNLQKYHIIGELRFRGVSQQNRTAVSFLCIDPNITKLLSSYTCRGDQPSNDIIRYQRLKFIPSTGIRESSLFVENMPLVDNIDGYGINPDQFTSEIANKKDLLKELERIGVVQDLAFDTNSTPIANFIFRNYDIMQVLKNRGRIFELITYTELKNTGYFDDIHTGVKISWDRRMKEYNDKLLERLDAMAKSAPGGICGYETYEYAKKVLNSEQDAKESGVWNEIDVIAMKGMTPVFVSCKDQKADKKEWVYEIASIAKRLNAVGVLALSKDILAAGCYQLALRSRQMGVSLMGFETILDEGRLRHAVQTITSGRIYSVLD